MTVVVKDLYLYGEDGLLLLPQLKDIVWNKKRNVVSYVVNNTSIEELILIEPFGKNFTPHLIEDFLSNLKAIPSVRIFSSIAFSEFILLPENIQIISESELETSEDFSSSPINNIPKVKIGDELKIAEIPPLWTLKISPDSTDPIGEVEEYIKNIEKGNVVVIVQIPLTIQEKEALESLTKETGGFVIYIYNETLKTKDNIETEFSQRMQNRIGKILGVKTLRGENI